MDQFIFTLNSILEETDLEKNEMGDYEEIDDDEQTMNEADFLPGGKGDNADYTKFEPSQISKGIEHEMEHTNDPRVALEIAIDHLTEDPMYYDHLDKIE